MEAARKGFLDIGVKDNEILVFSKLMDAKSLFLTANADTVYFVGFIDLSNGPMVFETPPDALGTLDDYWWRWVIDFGLPTERFWSLTLYDNQTRSMLDTPQRYPRAGSQSYPSPAAEPNADGSTTVYFSPTQPNGVSRGNWIQTTPGKGWFVILRLYSPSQPFFDKTWRVSEIEEIRGGNTGSIGRQTVINH